MLDADLFHSRKANKQKSPTQVYPFYNKASAMDTHIKYTLCLKLQHRDLHDKLSAWIKSQLLVVAMGHLVMRKVRVKLGFCVLRLIS